MYLEPNLTLLRLVLLTLVGRWLAGHRLCMVAGWAPTFMASGLGADRPVAGAPRSEGDAATVAKPVAGRARPRAEAAAAGLGRPHAGGGRADDDDPSRSGSGAWESSMGAASRKEIGRAAV